MTTNELASMRQIGDVPITPAPDLELPKRAKGSRRFSDAYKARILAEYDTLS